MKCLVILFIACFFFACGDNDVEVDAAVADAAVETSADVAVEASVADVAVEASVEVEASVADEGTPESD